MLLSSFHGSHFRCSWLGAAAEVIRAPVDFCKRTFKPTRKRWVEVHANRRGGFSEVFRNPNQASGLKCENRSAAILRGEKCVVTLLAESVQLKSAMLSTDRLQTKESQVPANFGSLLRLLDNRCLSFKLE